MTHAENVIKQHPFFEGLEERHVQLIARQAGTKTYQAGDFLMHSGKEATQFFLIISGNVAIELPGAAEGDAPIQSLGPGELLGWSWLFPPHRWRFDARAMSEVTVIDIDGEMVRDYCEENHELGYYLIKRFAQVMAQRIEATRFQLLDAYRRRKIPKDGA